MSARNRGEGREEETIYALIPQRKALVEKPLRHVSQFHGQVLAETQKRKEHPQTGAFGPPPTYLVKGAVTQKQPPAKLQLQDKEKQIQELDTTHNNEHESAKNLEEIGKQETTGTFVGHTAKGTCRRECCNETRRPPVPKRDERPEFKPPPSTDHIVENARKNITTSAKKYEPKYVDTPKGNAFPLEFSGLVPKYKNKKDYGKIPKYIKVKRHNDERLQNEQQVEYDNMVKANQPVVELSENDRQEVLDGLKKNWEEVYHQYQSLSLIIDTIPKKMRKEMLEAKLSQLERDIEMLEKPQKIFVAKNGQYSQ